MAAEAGVSASTEGGIWRGHGLKPHRIKTCKLSNELRIPGQGDHRSRLMPITISVFVGMAIKSPESEY